MCSLICEQVLGRISGENDPVVNETALNTTIRKQIQKMIDGLKGNLSDTNKEFQHPK